MKRIFALFFSSIFLFIVGCAAMTVLIERGVEGNTFHSERFPTVNVKVSDELQFMSHEQEKMKPETDTGATGSKNITVDSYLFGDNNTGRFLVIRVEFMLERNWFFNDPDYSTRSDILESGDEQLLGTRYSTGIFPVRNPDATVSLIKVWGRAAGDTTKFQIIYGEKVDMSWLIINGLAPGQQGFLQDFKQRAQKSFEVIP